MFEDYVAAVMADYEKKKETGALSFNLIEPTAAKVKSECISVCQERFNKGDERVLRPFFESREDADAYVRTIRLTNADKVKTLSNFLKGVTAKTEDRNIELLAWLIGYEHRPYSNWQKRSKEPAAAGKKDEIETTPGKPSNKTTTFITPFISSTVPGNTAGRKFSKIISAIAVLIPVALISFGTYHYFRNPGTPAIRTFTAATRPGGCMYWGGERYLPLPCNKKLGDTLIVALDTLRLNHFQKIMKTDTITQNCIGKIWYFKMNNKLEFFTAEGFHPVHPERKLKPVTRHILEKYVLNM